MKSYTDEEIDAKLREFEEKEARGECVWHSLDETLKHMNQTVEKLKKQRTKRRQSEAKKTNQIAPAI